MPEITRIFISYKKDVNVREAESLQYFLSQDANNDVWRDNNITPGEDWNNIIYTNLLKSDVVIVLVGERTAQSEWVRHEVALAQKFRIAVLAVGHNITESQMLEEVKALDITHKQYRILPKVLDTIDPTHQRVVEDMLRAPIKTCKERTQNDQKEFMNEVVKWLLPKPKAVAGNNPQAATFSLKVGSHTFKIHVAAGDIARVSPVHVLINSENNYMQMARAFESNSISARLRGLGASITRNPRQYNDTIQDELDAIIGSNRPISKCEVIPTSAGLQGSTLVQQNKARYIFHVSAVEAVESKKQFAPYQEPDDIRQSVYNCLRTVREVNEKQGVISPDGTPQHAAQVKQAAAGYEPIKSIIFPVFGSGQGGKEVKDVIDLMAGSLKEFLSDERDPVTLEDIYISSYFVEDVRVVIDHLRKFFTLEHADDQFKP
ncbi:MAG: TIR domain-containing protein [Anaerolineae bacterium]|nr:TIR domain-containing protein [Anaerolineae bacterium]